MLMKLRKFATKETGQVNGEIERSEPMTLAKDTYEEKSKEQINQYISEPIHELPEIFHTWSWNSIRPGMLEVFGTDSVNELYVQAVCEATQTFSKPARILSVGCGDGTVEIDLAKSLLSRGFDQFRIDGADLSPILIERFSASVAAGKLEKYVFPLVQDLNRVRSGQQYNVVMANHSLHHIVDLEGVFDFVREALFDDGIFATCDMIGRNGHMRWPETAAILQAIWPILSENQRFHHQLLQSHFEKFEDHDCSDVGFEGVRAQDILFQILERFSPYKFLACGGFVEVLVDRGYGHGFDSTDEQHVQFVQTFTRINDMMLDAGMIKPTVMMAYFSKQDRGQKYYRTRSAQNSIRIPFIDPEWTKYY